MKVTIEAFRCDRCATTQVPPKKMASDYLGPKEYALMDVAQNGGPVFHWCRPCYIQLLNYARGVETR